MSPKLSSTWIVRFGPPVVPCRPAIQKYGLNTKCHLSSEVGWVRGALPVSDRASVVVLGALAPRVTFGFVSMLASAVLSGSAVVSAEAVDDFTASTFFGSFVDSALRIVLVG